MTEKTLDTPSAVADHPAVVAARALAADLLVPAAAEVDAATVPRSHLTALAGAGLVGLAGPVAHGGGGAPPPVVREVVETLSGACGSTWFVLTQHAMPLAVTAASTNAAVTDRWLRPLATGDALAGVAVSHLRRPGPASVTASRVDGGWEVSGFVGWMTSWGIADVLLLGAVTDDDRHLLALVGAHDQPGLTSLGRMDLAAMGATSTTQLRLENLHVPDDAVVELADRAAWLEKDRCKTANVTPAVFGLLRAALGRLRQVGEKRGDPAILELADALEQEGAALREQAYLLIDDVKAADAVPERLVLRAHANELLVRATSALVVAGAGASMARSDPAQRYAREAMFHLVQAQTGPVRAAEIARFAALG